MNNVKINFLRSRRKNLSVQQEQDRRYALIGGAVFFGIFLLSFTLIGIEWFLSNRASTLNRQQRLVEDEITALAAEETEYLVLAEKAKKIEELISNKIEKQQALEFFTTEFANLGVTLKEVQLGQGDNMRFNIETKSVFETDQVIAHFRSTDILTSYPGLSLVNVTRDKTAGYRMEVTIPLSDKQEVAKK